MNVTELEELMAERRRINEEIRRIKNKGIVVIPDAVKLDVVHYPTGTPDDWVVSVMVKNGNSKRWTTVIRDPDWDKAISQIPDLIKNLEALYDLLFERYMQKEVEE